MINDVRKRLRVGIFRSGSVAVVAQLLIFMLLGGVAIAETGSVATVTETGSNLVVFRDPRTFKAAGAFISADGAVGPTFQISTGNIFSSLGTATSGSNHLVVWLQGSDLGCFSNVLGVHGAIVREDGSVSDPFEISTPDICDLQGAFPSPDDFDPNVGFDGTNYFVVWHALGRLEGDAIMGARVTPQGVVLEPDGVPLIPQPDSGSIARPDLAFDGLNFLVVYRAAMGELCQNCMQGIYAARVNTAARPVALDPQGIMITERPFTADADFGGVAFDGLNWVVVWTQFASKLMGARVSRAGIVIDPLGELLASGVEESWDPPALVFDGENVLVVWNDLFDAPSYAALFKAGQSPLEPAFQMIREPFSVWLDDEPDTALSAGGFLLVGEIPNTGYPGEVGGVRIATDGTLLDPQPFRISTVDTNPPDTTITSAPPSTTNLTDASFSFDSSEAGSTFECRLDDGVYSACSSPQTYGGLESGTHTFEVAATDSSGNKDPTPASYSWNVDVSAPETTITSGPPTFTNSTTTSHSFISSESGSSFECKIDGEVFSSCSSPKTHSGLNDGAHTFEVRAMDLAGNVDPTPASRAWTIDTTAPGAPTLSSPINGSSTSNTKPTFDWSDAGDSSGVSYQIQVDNSGSEFPSPEIDQSGLAASSFTPTTSLALGTYSWRARAVDGAGNVGAWSAVFTVTVTGPQGTIAGKVTSQSNKQPIGGAIVNCGNGGTATTAPDGTYSISAPAGTYACTASASGYTSASKTVTVKANRTATANFALRKA